MTMLDRVDNKLAGFVLKGQMADVAIERVQKVPRQKGEITFDDIAARVGMKDLDEDEVEAARKMSAVYIVIASFENTVRDLISTRMLEVKKDNWWEQCVSAEIQKKAQRKMDEEKKIRWHKSRGLSPIYFTEIGDLVSIIQHNWDVFVDIIQDIEWLRQIIRSIERSRNVIMHSGQLSLDDIERVGVNIRDYIRQVGA
jgi:Swt1-like HEPN